MIFLLQIYYLHNYFKLLLSLPHMVRLQKIAYQRILNINAFGRARIIETPRKWHATNPEEQLKLKAHRFTNSIIGKILSPFMNWLVQFQLRWQKDLFLQQGLTFQDKLVHHDAELRRDVLFEHMARQNLHPYHVLLKTKRRERYYKVQRGLRGFFVPNHVRSEAEGQTLPTALQLRDEWKRFIHDNYFSDMTPSARGTVLPKIIPLQLILCYGSLNPEAWDRYFYNQGNYGYFSQQKLKIVRDPTKFPYDLSTSQGKVQFQDHIRTFVKNNPGVVIPANQTLDFNKLYAALGV